MTRSKNGREVAMRQPEMTAMAVYTSNRSETSTRPWESQRAAKEPPAPFATALRHHDMS
jgi:hypothetical protein